MCVRHALLRACYLKSSSTYAFASWSFMILQVIPCLLFFVDIPLHPRNGTNLQNHHQWHWLYIRWRYPPFYCDGIPCNMYVSIRLYGQLAWILTKYPSRRASIYIWFSLNNVVLSSQSTLPSSRIYLLDAPKTNPNMGIQSKRLPTWRRNYRTK
jgi:hypothetical protein